MHSHPHLDRHPAHRAVIGLGVIAIGTLALLDNLHLFDVALLRTFWPLALVLVGLARLAWRREAIGGVVLVAVGGLLTAHNLGHTLISMRDAWPVIVIAAGLSMLLRGLFPRARG